MLERVDEAQQRPGGMQLCQREVTKVAEAWRHAMVSERGDEAQQRPGGVPACLKSMTKCGRDPTACLPEISDEA